MKVAIYSRIFESTQQKDLQTFFDELNNEKIVPVIYQDFFLEIKAYVTLPDTVEIFTHHSELKEDIDFLISLGRRWHFTGCCNAGSG